MIKVAGLIPTYSSDEFGACQALYELGGMVVMHDASGCNSTYTTHDEPRWYDQDSMIYISAISEMEAIMGDDDKLIEDICETAEALRPKFIAVVGAPIPYMIGTDFYGIASVIEERTGIVTLGIEANGMRDYTTGVSLALESLVKRFCVKNYKISKRLASTKSIQVNILGATPMDLDMYTDMASIEKFLESAGFIKGVSLSIGSSLEEIARISLGDVNLVVSYGGLKCAKVLKDRFNIPYVVGVPLGKEINRLLIKGINEACKSGKNHVIYKDFVEKSDIFHKSSVMSDNTKTVGIIGETVMSNSLACQLELNDTHILTRVFCPVDTCDELLRKQDLITPWEDDIMAAVKEIDVLVADPLYKPVCPEKVKFVEQPHEAFSGRIYLEKSKGIENIIEQL